MMPAAEGPTDRPATGPEEGARTQMSRGAHRSGRLAYPVTALMLALAGACPIALTVLDPTLMFERGWEQYVGTAIYLWAVLTLANELRRLGRDERAFQEAPILLGSPEEIAADDRRVLPAPLRHPLRHHGAPPQ